MTGKRGSAVPTPGKLWGKTYGDYVFHDDYYWFYSFQQKKHSKEPLTHYPDRFAIFYISEKKEEVKEGLEAIGFRFIKETMYNYRFQSNSSILCDVSVIEGKGSITDIPYVIYSCPMYVLNNGKMFGADPKFSVRFDESKAQEQQLRHYADIHNLIPLGPEGKGSISRKYYAFECTNESSGNAIEMANWFVECTEFKIAQARFGDLPINIEQ